MYTLQQLKDQFAKLGYIWPKFHLIGIRANNYIPNTFCDTFILVNNNVLTQYSSTTRPGGYYLLHLLNPNGAAVLKEGQYVDTWTLGLHRGKYKAWVQAKPVTVYRDQDLDMLAEEGGKEDKGLFGIDIHRSNEFTISKLVDKYSAGCQVFADPKNFSNFIELSEQTKQKFFTYTLLKPFEI